jgi:hypothetical protein
VVACRASQDELKNAMPATENTTAKLSRNLTLPPHLCDGMPPHLIEVCCGDAPKLPANHCVQHLNAWRSQNGLPPLDAANSTTPPGDSNRVKLPTPPDFRLLPCQHRGDTHRTDKCRACGAKNIDAPVYTCNLHRECTVKDFKLPKTKVCRGCSDFIPRTVSVLITARNYGKYLAEAIESALGQSVPVEVIYSDDFSTDDSVEIAQRYPITVLTARKHLGVAEARNRGFAASGGDYIVHLDGDDVLPEFFVEDHLKAIAPGIPFVYGPAQAFGMHDTLWGVEKWDKTDLWAGNSVNTSAMYARWAFMAAGGWRDGIGTMWDWDLALRASRLGTPRPSTATLKYRQHAESFSQQTQEASNEKRHDFQDRMRRLNATVSIGAIVSGRVPGLFDEWFRRLEATVLSHVETDLTILDNSGNPELKTRMLRLTGESERFSRIRVLPYPVRYEWESEDDRRNKVATFMADASNRLLDLMRGDMAWFVEDDVMLPHNAMVDLRATLMGKDCPHAAAGAYLSRHDWPAYIAGWKRDKNWPHVQALPEYPTEVDYAGTGCLMFWRNRPAIPKRFVSHVEGIPAHDWAFGMELKRNGGTMLLVPSVKCGHAVSESEIRT